MAASEIPVAPFHWRDAERQIVFGRGRLAEADALLDEPFALLTTPRAAAAAPGLVELARAVHEVPAGRVDELAGELRGQVDANLLVALGGGRVIDTAKALAAADAPRRVAAVPTTLSGAEMTPIHRHASGVAAHTPRVRPALVLNDPALCASQPGADLAQSAGNALGHAVEGPATTLTNPVAGLAGVAAAQLIAAGFGGDAAGLGADAPAFAPDTLDEAARDGLALAALLAGYAIGSAGYGLHHVVSQTLARFAGVPHGAANTIMLPHTAEALARRASAWTAQLSSGLGSDPVDLARRLVDVSGLTGLRDFGVSDDDLEVCARQAS
ncbi:MAG: iron-containing alcohol dehydrogenase, partial [Solirubrobacterales bacterium]|nr:iron-containing alcohol dehydrogenase [Solirubrobacterales bacterium]